MLPQPGGRTSLLVSSSFTIDVSLFCAYSLITMIEFYYARLFNRVCCAWSVEFFFSWKFEISVLVWDFDADV